MKRSAGIRQEHIVTFKGEILCMQLDPDESVSGPMALHKNET
jgi:hypothetical protein